MVPSVCGNPCDASWPEDARTGGVLRPRVSLRCSSPTPAATRTRLRRRPVAQALAVPPASTLSTIATHYEILGVPTDASVERIRAAYRDRARRYHPDRIGGHDPADAMAAVNEAYRVLGDPIRRGAYDRSLRGGANSATPFTAQHGDGDIETPPPPPEPSRLMPAGPARVPWKFMLVAAVAGSALVLAAAAFTDPPSEEVPDGILRTGSCVTIETNGDVREIACTGTTDDLIVDLVIPTDARCPSDMGSYRDRLGLGTVCIAHDDR